MKQKLLMLLIAAVLAVGTIFLTACVVKETPAATEEIMEEQEQITVTGMNGFSLLLMERLLENKEPEENMVVSPYSVWLCLAALTNGTREEVKADLFAALGYPEMTQEGFNATARILGSMPVQTANALFVSENAKLRESFEDMYTREYEGGLFAVDFSSPQAVEDINAWAAEKTEGHIEKILESIHPETRAAIANAVYFADGWNTAFPEENTRDGVFYGISRNQTVPFMNRRFSEIPYYEDDKMQVTVLTTTQGGELWLMLPKDGYSAEEVLSACSRETLDAMRTAERSTVILSLPGFRVKTEPFSVLEQLQEMGIVITDREHSYLTELAEGEELTISQAMHSAMLEVDEKGMTAAAATVMGMMRMSMPRETEPVELTFDKPFAFLLTMDANELGNQILFGGVINHIE